MVELQSIARILRLHSCNTTIMPHRSRTEKISTDDVQAAFNMIRDVINETEGTGKNPFAVALGRRGGLKGGPARKAALSSARRREIAVNAVQARWRKAKQNE
jgi:hypothetical protein